MEYLPIIPLNDNEEGNTNEEIPEELPLLPLRNTVLFPGVVIPITVGREKSIRAVNEAYKKISWQVLFPKKTVLSKNLRLRIWNLSEPLQKSLN